MKRIMFQLPLNRFTENDAGSTRAALRQAFRINDRNIDEMIADAEQHRQFVIHFSCDAEQFSTFLIKRNELGSRNLFADLKARILDNTAVLQNRRIVDFVFVGPSYAKEGYRIHDDLPQSFVDQQNDKRAEQRAFKSSAEARRAANERRWRFSNDGMQYGGTVSGGMQSELGKTVSHNQEIDVLKGFLSRAIELIEHISPASSTIMRANCADFLAHAKSKPF